MKKPVFYTLICLLGLVATCSAQAQEQDSLDYPQKSKTIFLATGVQYISNLTYAGRGSINSVPLFLPSFTFVTTKGFFVGVAGYVNTANNNYNIDGGSITPGYVFSFGKKSNWSGYVSGTKYFFKDSSAIILSAFKATADAQIALKTKFFKIATSSSLQFGKTTNDITNTLELSKKINLDKRKTFSIEPIVSFMLGTQSFSETYYMNGTRKKTIVTNPPQNQNPIGSIIGGNNSQTSPQQTTITEPYTQEMRRAVKKYQTLSLSFSTPFNFKMNKLSFNFTPYLISPLHTVGSSSSKNLYLFTAGINYTF